MMTYYEGINGGVLPFNSPTYVWREADDSLYESLQNSNNHVCCVLAARQMGKTSLMVKTSKRLTDEGVICLQINLQKFGQISDENSFYHTLLDLICKRIKSYDPQILTTLRNFWDSQSSAISRTVLFQEFITTEILPKIHNQQFIIFLDEIQALNNWGIQNSFLGFLRAIFDSSVSDSPLHNLKFVLLGVISPSDLLTSGDVAFNQREEIQLGYFNRALEFFMTHPLLKGLEKKSNSPQKLLQEIISWTRGQPFLTQWLCHIVEQNWTQSKDNKLQLNVEKLVQNEIIDNWKQQRRDSQDHFQSIERWFTMGYAQSKEKMSALNCYLELWNNQQPRPFDSNNKDHINLIVSGLAQKTNLTIDVTNPIYQQIFDLKWIKKTQQFIQQQKNTPMAEERNYTLIIDRSPSMTIVDNPDDLVADF
ncbi:MAG: AAA-like domain-containing protein [Microcystaceae cyanobacterium]